MIWLQSCQWRRQYRRSRSRWCGGSQVGRASRCVSGRAVLAGVLAMRLRWRSMMNSKMLCSVAYPVSRVESNSFDFDKHVVWRTFWDWGIVHNADILGAKALECFHCFGNCNGHLDGFGRLRWKQCPRSSRQRESCVVLRRIGREFDDYETFYPLSNRKIVQTIRHRYFLKDPAKLFEVGFE